MAQIFDLSKEVKRTGKVKNDKVQPIYFNFDNKKYLIKNDFETLYVSSKALEKVLNATDSDGTINPVDAFSIVNEIPEVLEKLVNKEFVDKIIKLDYMTAINIYTVILYAVVETGSIEKAYKIVFPELEEEKEPEDE